MALVLEVSGKFRVLKNDDVLPGVTVSRRLSRRHRPGAQIVSDGDFSVRFAAVAIQALRWTRVSLVCFVLGGGLLHSALADELLLHRAPTTADNKTSVDSNAKALRISPEMALELKHDRAAIDAEKATLAQLKLELQVAKQALDVEKADVKAIEEEAEAMRTAVDAGQRKVRTDRGSDVSKFNRSAKEYNALATEAIDKRARLNATIAQYNELATRQQTQAMLINKMSEAYNEKLVRNGR